MKALVKLKPATGIWMQDMEIPRFSDHEVLIKVKKTAICGTDIHIYHWNDWAKHTIPLPLIIGHEFVGEIVDFGQKVKNFKIGDRVSGEGHITCGYCRNCKGGRPHLCRKTIGVGVTTHGAFAEYLVIPEQNVFPLPEHIPDEHAALLDPLGNATHCALAYDLVGEDVLITGAGPIGLMAVAICRHIGARHIVITDLNEYRLNLAKKIGATRAINVKDSSVDPSVEQVMEELDMKEGFDVGLEMSGSPQALSQMINLMNNGGNIALLGIAPPDTSINWQQVIFKGLTLKGIYGRKIFETWYKMSSMLQCGLDLKPILTHQYDISDYQQAFQHMSAGNTGKVILNWD